MSTTSIDHVNLISQWFILPGDVEKVLAALPSYVEHVRQQEPGTLMYLVNSLRQEDRSSADLQTLPPAAPCSLWFIEEYESETAFLSHLHGPAFTGFVADYGQYFVNADNKPYSTVTFLRREQGFIRKQGADAVVPQIGQGNRHPAVMFEIIANDQDKAKAFYSTVFGWRYQSGSAGFAYVHFPLQLRTLLGGIGLADAGVPGMEPGHSFYLLVDDIQAAIDRALAAGGRTHMPVTSVDGYTFAMIKDPEGNPIGLLQAN